MADINVKEYITELVKRAKIAQKEFERTATDQLTIDKVVRAVGKTIYDNREELARDACEENQQDPGQYTRTVERDAGQKVRGVYRKPAG